LDLEIEKTARKTKLRKVIEEFSTTSTNHIEPIQEEINIVEETQLSPRRTLGDYAMQ